MIYPSYFINVSICTGDIYYLFVPDYSCLTRAARPWASPTQCTTTELMGPVEGCVLTVNAHQLIVKRYLCQTQRQTVNTIHWLNIYLWQGSEGRKQMFYLMIYSTHFIYGYMASAGKGWETSVQYMDWFCRLLSKTDSVDYYQKQIL